VELRPAEVRPAQIQFPYFTMLISPLVQCVYSLADAPEEFFVGHRFRKRFAKAALNQKESPSGRNMRLADFVIRLRVSLVACGEHAHPGRSKMY